MNPIPLARMARRFPGSARWPLVLALLCGLIADAVAGIDTCAVNQGRWGGGPPRETATWSQGGEHLLLVGAGSELVLFDAGDAQAPVRLGSVTLDHVADRIAVSPDGTLASVSDGFDVLTLVDIADRHAPVRRGGHAWAGLEQPHGMAFDAAGHLYVAVRTLGLSVLDVSNPDNPVRIGDSDGAVSDYVFDVALRGNYAYLAQRDDGVRVVDISDPADPVVVGSHAASQGAAYIRISGNRAYVAGSNGFMILGLSNPLAPVTLGSADPGDTYAVQPLPGDRLMVSSGGIRIFDIATPASPVQLGHWVAHATYRAVLRGTHAYVPRPGNGDWRLRVIDVADAAAPAEVGQIAFAGLNSEVSVGDDHVLVAASTQGVAMLDTNDPAAPTLAGVLSLPHDALRVAHVNGYAVVSGGLDPRISIIDPQPAGPVLAASLDTGVSAHWLAVDGTRLYIAEGWLGGLGIYEMANPLVPHLLGRFIQVGGSMIVRVAVADGVAYAGDVNDATLRVIDVSNPAVPVQIGSLLLPGGVTSIDAAGDVVFVGTQLHGVRILRHQGGGTLQEIADIPVPLSSISGVSVDGERLHISAGAFSGLLVYDIADASDPQFVEQHNTAGEAVGVDAANGVIALAEGNSGVTVFGCDASAGNQAPVRIGAISDQVDDEGEAIFPLSVHPNFDDPDGHALSYSASGLPPGLVLGSGNGVITGIPTVGSHGHYTVTITAIDPFGLSATQSFEWEVLPISPQLFRDGFE